MNIVIFPERIGKVTEKAFQVFVEGESFWLPKSKTRAMARKASGETEYKVILPKWLAEEKGFLSKAQNGNNIYLIQGTEETI